MKFSVIVPTYNRLRLLKRAIESLLAQGYQDYEIIVVDDGSTDGTEKYMSELLSGGRVKYIRQPNRGPAIARNEGMRASTGEFIAFTDDDCVVPDNWLKSLADRLEKDNAAGAGGPSLSGDNENPFAEANDMIVNFLKTEINKAKGARAIFLTTNNTAYKKSSLLKVGGFDENFRIGAEERDLNYRLYLEGEKLVYDESIVVSHFNDADFAAFVRHQYDQGKGSFIFHDNILKRYGKRPEMIPFGTYLKMFLHPFRHTDPVRGIVLFLLVMLAQIAVTAGYFSARSAGSAYSGKEKV